MATKMVSALSAAHHIELKVWPNSDTLQNSWTLPTIQGTDEQSYWIERRTKEALPSKGCHVTRGQKSYIFLSVMFAAPEENEIPITLY